MKPLLEVHNLYLYYSCNKHKIKAIDGVSFSIQPHETFSLVGESGCGKTSIAKAIMRIAPISSGTILYKGSPLPESNRKKERYLHRNIQMVFQDSSSSLSPRMTVKDIILEPLYIHKVHKNYDLDAYLEELFQAVGLNTYLMSYYPHELSGGQKQRVCIARALALQPNFIIFDESISALDVSVQAQIVNLLQKLQKERGLTYLFISHDLSMVRYLSTHIAVMYKGKIVEIATADQIYQNPIHPYTKNLIRCIPTPDPINEKKRVLSPHEFELETLGGNLVEVENKHYVVDSIATSV